MLPDSATAILTVDLNALAGNWRLLATRAGAAECAAVVKADAYGVGASRAAPALAAAGCRTFFVATAEEGANLRHVLGPDPNILAMNGPTEAVAADLLAHGVMPVLNSLGQIEVWAAAARVAGTPLAAALHVDTGMNRLGLPPAEVAVLAREPQRLDGILVALVLSHFACADEPAHPKNQDQIVSFLRLKGALAAAPASLANSAGIFLGAHTHFDLVRPGAALYGINPTPAEANPMAQVVHLQGKILQVRQIDSPESVGYGADFLAESPRRIATVAVGYADGYHRSLGGRGAGMLNGFRVPLAGRVSMDLLTLDVTDAPPGHAEPGAWISLIGGGVSVDEVAAAAGTIGYEILTSLGQRIHRVYTGGPNA